MVFDARRSVLVSCFSTLLVVSCYAAFAFGAESYLLESTAAPGNLTRVTARLEVQGDLKLNPAGQKVVRLPVEATGKVVYDEKLLAPLDRSPQRFRTIRYYRQAKAEIRGDQDTQERALREDRRLIVVDDSDAPATLFSPIAPLSRDELELIDIQGARVRPAALLPDESVAVGQNWRPEDRVLAALLGLDVANQSDVKCALAEVKDDLAIVKLAGKLDGAVGGVSSQIELKGEYRFDLTAKRITDLTMEVRENRAIGHTTPGLEVTARLQMTVAPIDDSPPLSEQALAQLPLDGDRAVTHLEFRSQTGAFQLLHDRRWRVMMDGRRMTILRLVDRGDLIAQCNISILPKRPEENRISPAKFREQIAAALGPSAAEIVDAAETTDGDGRRILRVTAAGVVSELPIEWIYYHLSDKQGRAAAFIFTLESKLVQRFATADEPLVANFRFSPPATEAF